jgi:hypothetical protein
VEHSVLFASNLAGKWTRPRLADTLAEEFRISDVKKHFFFGLLSSRS